MEEFLAVGQFPQLPKTSDSCKIANLELCKKSNIFFLLIADIVIDKNISFYPVLSVLCRKKKLKFK